MIAAFLDILSLTPTQAALLIAAFVVGGVVKGGIGFGLPLVTISLAPLIVPIDLALALNAIVLPLTNLWQVAQTGRPMQTVRRFWPVLVGVVIAIPPAAALAALASPDMVTLAVGLCVMGFVALTALNPRFAIADRHETRAGVLTGLVAGAVAALTSAPGPVFVMFLVARRVERRMMLSALGVFLLIGALLIALAAVGWLTGPRAALGVVCAAAGAGGMALGYAAAGQLSARAFSVLVKTALFALGATMTARAAGWL